MNNGIQAKNYSAEYQNIAEVLPGQQLNWLTAQREAAFEKFSTQGFPSPREEEWRYTNVSALEKKQFAVLAGAEESRLDEQLLADHTLQDAWVMVIVDGHFKAELSVLQDLPETVTVCSMTEALHRHPEQVQAGLGTTLAGQEHGFIHFNTAWFSGGLFLHVPEHTVLQKPLQIIQVTTREAALITTRSLLLIDAHAQAEVIETYIGNAGISYLLSAVNEVLIAENAQLTLTKIQDETDKAYHFGGTYVKQARDARLLQHSFSFGALLARNEIHCDLQQAAECELNGLYLGRKRQLIDNHTRINHLQPNARSRETYKGILDQRARGVFQGRVLVCEDAQKTDSDMQNRNLLLSDDAEVDTKPQLEIYADDVKCAHGVTVGQLDEQSVFYLQSRCVDATTARNILTFAFANEMVDKVAWQSLRQLLLKLLLHRFPQTGMRKEWLS